MGNNEILNQLETQIIGEPLTPRERQVVPLEAGALASITADMTRGVDTRESFIEALKNSQNSISKRKAEVLQQLSEDRPMSRSQVVAAALMALAPVIGGLVKGKRGALAGGKALGSGTQALAVGLANQQKRTDLKGEAELEALRSQEKDITTRVLAQQDKILGREEKMEDQKELIKLRAANDTTGQGLSALAKAIQIQEKTRLVPVPPQLQEELGEVTTAATLNGRLDTLFKEKRLQPEKVSSTEASSIGALQSVEDLTVRLKSDYEGLTSTAQGSNLITRSIASVIPGSKTKQFDEKMKGYATAIGKAVEKDRFSDQDREFWVARMPASTDTVALANSKIDSITHIIQTLKTAKISAQLSSGRDAVKFVSSSPVSITALPEQVERAAVGELISFISEKDGLIKVVQKQPDGILKPINFTMETNAVP